MPARIATLALVILGLGLPVAAQPPDSITVSDTLSSNGDSFVVQVRGFASARFQPKDSYSGTWEVQCSVDGGTTYDTDDEVNLSLEGASSAAVQEVTDTVGIWTASVAGCTHLKVIATAGFAASDTTIAVGAVVSGGSSGPGGGSLSCPTCATDVVLGTDTYTEATSTAPGLFIRRDTLTSPVGTTNEFTPAPLSAEGALWTTLSATTNGGCTPNSSISTAAVMETAIKATAGQLYELVITNIDATPVYAKLYNDTAANTDETDTPVGRYGVPGTSAVGGIAATRIAVGMAFSTAITLRVTTGIADNDTGALSANEVLVSYCYK
jgi:hypothetical protein